MIKACSNEITDWKTFWKAQGKGIITMTAAMVPYAGIFLLTFIDHCFD